MYSQSLSGRSAARILALSVDQDIPAAPTDPSRYTLTIDCVRTVISSYPEKTTWIGARTHMPAATFLPGFFGFAVGQNPARYPHRVFLRAFVLLHRVSRCRRIRRCSRVRRRHATIFGRGHVTGGKRHQQREREQGKKLLHLSILSYRKRLQRLSNA